MLRAFLLDHQSSHQPPDRLMAGPGLTRTPSVGARDTLPGRSLSPASANTMRTPYVRRDEPIHPVTGGVTDRFGPCPLRDPLLRRDTLSVQSNC